MIVFDDADVAQAAEGIAIAGYFNAGQDCTAATRVLAGPRVHDDFVAALAEQARRTPAPARRTTATSLYGPLNNANQLDAGQRLPRAHARPRDASSPAATGRATAATSSSRRSSTACARTTR